MNRFNGCGDGGGGMPPEVTTTCDDDDSVERRGRAAARCGRHDPSLSRSAIRSDWRLGRRRPCEESLDDISLMLPLPLLLVLVVTFSSLMTTARATHVRAASSFHDARITATTRSNAFVPIPTGSPTTGTNWRLRGIDHQMWSQPSSPSLRIGDAAAEEVYKVVPPLPPAVRSPSRVSASSTRLTLSMPSPSTTASGTYTYSFLPLIRPTDDWGNVAVLSAAASAAHVLGSRTAIGRLLGPPVSAMAIAFLAGSVGVLPPGGSAGCKILQSLSLQLATPLLLLGADLRGCGERAVGPLLVAFILASVGTILASCVAVTIFGTALSMSMPNPSDGIKIAAALMAKNVGGGINYVAVCRSLDASPVAVAAGLCVDNIFALVYFPATSALASGLPDVEEEDVSDKDVSGADPVDETGGASGSREEAEVEGENSTADLGSTQEGGGEERCDGDEDGGGSDDAGDDTSPTDAAATTTSSTTTTPTTLTVGDVSTALSLSLLSTWMGERVGGPYNAALPTSTLFTVLLTSLAPEKWLRPLRPAGEILGTAMLYLFFATAGAPGMSVADSVRRAFVPLGCFLCVLYGLHGAFLYASRRLFLRFNVSTGAVAPQRLLAASSAAIGGPATAAALAQANGWTSLLAPSLLVGNLGYAVATFAGLAFHALFRG